jgi:raffinose/stachyose/melibiose transport system permease protein
MSATLRRSPKALGSALQVGAEPASVAARSRLVKIASYLVLSLVAVLYIWPIFMLINTALKSLPQYLRDPAAVVSEPSLANFGEAWELANFSQYMVNSALYAVTATAIFVVTSLFVAFPVARGFFKGSKVVLTMYVVALFLPPALIPQFQLILNMGLYNTRPGFILLFLINPIGMIILVNYMKSIPRELDESAAVDGAGYLRYVTSIIFPLIKPAVATVTVLHAIGIWNELILPTIYLTNEDYFPITRGLIVFEGVYGSNWPGIAAAVLMLMVPMLVLYVFLQRHIIGGLTAGAVKG